MKRIPIEPTFAAWRRAAREALREGLEPRSVEWIETTLEPGVEAEQAAAPRAEPAPNETAHSAGLPHPARPAFAIPRELLARLKTAACFRADDRWALLYRILWRWTHGERDVIELRDPDGMLLAQRVETIEQETAELVLRTRFRRRDPSMGPPEFVGWYEPHHDLLERAAAEFVEGMGDSTWMLATPQGAAFWNGMLLRIDRPAAEESIEAAHALPASAMTGEAITSEPAEALWLAWYANVVNDRPVPVPLGYWRMPPAGPPLPADLARERTRLGAQRAAVSVPQAPPIEASTLMPPLREPSGPLATCRRCGLWRNAKQAVAGIGPAHAAIMALGEQPGEYENQHGEPFGGAAGQLLDTVLARAGLERAALYLTYAVKHYKWEIPGKQQPGRQRPHQQRVGEQRIHRTPERSEADACGYWLQDELTRVAPRVVVALGPTALKALTGTHVNLSEYLGLTIAHRGRLIVPTWHPSYALRTADARLREDIVANMVAAFSRAAVLAAQEP
ncbi:DUF4130 domain-containing protein [Paraburkholderia susongensis]|uniref:DNA polymerase n=1 Tax=Paraburkholderia susongensis TaxID=1515439 RepID=A0A1X7M7A9_9BURK|nr:DUF4130 domain-containing protein [Paraburkholderia susongensis]SMG61403.1 DNA polymerase [Paraburkholderia susongensis]